MGLFGFWGYKKFVGVSKKVLANNPVFLFEKLVVPLHPVFCKDTYN
jgi:hypothetical protein